MRKDVKGRFIVVPTAPVEIEPVFRDICQVDDSEHRGMVRPGIGVVRRRLSQVVETGPDKLTEAPFIVLIRSQVLIRDIRPLAMACVVGAGLVVGIDLVRTYRDREVIDAAGADRGGRLASEDYSLRQNSKGLAVAMYLVIEACDVELCSETVAKHRIELIHSAGHRP